LIGALVLCLSCLIRFICSEEDTSELNLLRNTPSWGTWVLNWWDWNAEDEYARAVCCWARKRSPSMDLLAPWPQAILTEYTAPPDGVCVWMTFFQPKKQYMNITTVHFPLRLNLSLNVNFEIKIYFTLFTVLLIITSAADAFHQSN